jgi:hypothetical protein
MAELPGMLGLDGSQQNGGRIAEAKGDWKIGRKGGRKTGRAEDWKIGGCQAGLFPRAVGKLGLHLAAYLVVENRRISNKKPQNMEGKKAFGTVPWTICVFPLEKQVGHARADCVPA